MASDVEFMSYYRDVYLKSEEWKTLRLEVLKTFHFACKLCKTKDGIIDVHHLDYRNLWDVKKKDLVPLCRACHIKVHALLVKFKKLKRLSCKQQWRIILTHLSPERDRYLDQIATNTKEFSRPVMTRKEIKMLQKPNPEP